MPATGAPAPHVELEGVGSGVGAELPQAGITSVVAIRRSRPRRGSMAQVRPTALATIHNGPTRRWARLR